MAQLIVMFDDGITPKLTGEVLDLRSGSNPAPIPPDPNPIPVPPNPVPPGVGHDVIQPPAAHQVKCPISGGSYEGEMALDFVAQPAGLPGKLGLIRTAPAIGGDNEAGGALVEWTDPDGVTHSRTYEAPFTVWYATDQDVPGAYFRAKVGSTIRVTTIQPTKPYFADYRTPTI